MRVVFVNVVTLKAVLDAEVGNTAPHVGDIIQHPSEGPFVVVQRAFIFEEVMKKGFDIGSKKSMEVVLQVAMNPISGEHK